MKKLQYRTEIDGLRALAVLPVILFHAGFEVFSGGFIGVDVFFVISGYLITTIIAEDLSGGRFSFRRFYYRRMRRIMPALFFVMLACIPMAWHLMPPDQLQSFANSLVAVSIFSSNFLLWQESDYFSAAAELKPLLHTWSLAIEEQFYLLFPVLMFVIWRLARAWVMLIMSLLAVCSFLIAQWFFASDEAAKFFLLPSRVWELLAGSLAAIFAQKCGVRRNNILSLSGLSLILLAVFILDENTPFPSAYTLLPIIGTVLIILCSDENTVVGRILSQKVFVGVGLISYSAYLWHQPIFAFARIISADEVSLEIMALLSGAAVILAFLTWKYIEVPFRFGGARSMQITCYSFVVGALIIFGVFYYFINHKDLAYTRYVTSAQNILYDKEINRKFMVKNGFDRFGCFFDQKQEAMSLIEKECHKLSDEKPNIVLFGDSEAAHYSRGLEEFASENGFNLVVFTGASCRPHVYQGKKRCEDFLELFDRYVLPNIKSGDVIVVSSNWTGSHMTIGDEGFKAVVRDLLVKLTDTPSAVLVIANTADFVKDPYIELSKRTEKDGEQYVEARDYRRSDEILREASEEFDVKAFFPASSLCRFDAEIECLFMKDGQYLFFDTGHLSYLGSEQMIRKMAPLLLYGHTSQ